MSIRTFTLTLLFVPGLAFSSAENSLTAASASTTTDLIAAAITPATPTSKATLKPFSARYKSNLKVGWITINAEGNRTLTHLGGERWRFEFNAEASVATLKETSEFLLRDGKIYPQKYTYRTTGLITDKNRTLSFDHDKKQIFDHEKNEVAMVDIGSNPTEDDLSPLRIIEIEKQNELDDEEEEDESKSAKKKDQDVEQEISWYDNVQDNTTFMLQAGLDLQNGAQNYLIYPVFERHRVKVKRYKVLAEESLKTPVGALRTLKAIEVRSEKKRKIYIWLALDHQYQLVRLQDQKKGKTTYQIDISRIR